MECTKKVINKKTGDIVEILSVRIKLPYKVSDTDTLNIKYETFVDGYEEYVDPKDIRIEALENELRELKEKIYAPAKKRTRVTITDGIRREIADAIKKGATKEQIKLEYSISFASYDRIRKLAEGSLI